MCKIMNFKAKKGKNKYNMLEWWIKKSLHLRNPFYKKSYQNLNQVWSKSWFIDPTIGSCWILDRLVGHIFPFEKIFYEPKIGVKLNEISQTYQNLNKIFTVFFKKADSFLPDFVQ